MPNWCDNRLAIRGTPSDVMELVETVAGETLLDFERLLPMPSHIREGADHHAPGVPDGLPGWYQWSVEHWGTKWNAVDVKRRGYGRTGRVRYRFLTAYGPPGGVLNEIARRFPQVEIDLTYDVELMEGGVAEWREGRLSRTEGEAGWSIGPP